MVVIITVIVVGGVILVTWLWFCLCVNFTAVFVTRGM